MEAVLTGEPRLTGVDQSENSGGSSASAACREASRPGGTGWGGALVESSRQRARASASSSTPCADGDLMEPPRPRSSQRAGGGRGDSRTLPLTDRSGGGATSLLS